MRRIAFLFSLLTVLCLAAPARSVTVEAPVIDTAITGGPLDHSTIEDDGASFSFVATRDGVPYPTAFFECSLDASPPTPCSSPKDLDGLAPGTHNFTVVASDPESEASDPQPATRSFIVTEPTECEEESEAEEEVDDDEFQFEGTDEASEEGCAEEAGPGQAPSECLLRSADAHLSALPASERVRLVLRYTTYAPAEAVVSLRGGRGAPKLLETHEHLARQGVLRLTARLSKGEAARIRLARKFTVETTIPAAPELCRRYDSRHLTVRHVARNQVSWAQSDSIFSGS